MTDERIDAIWADMPAYGGDYRAILEFARAIEAEVLQAQEPVAWFAFADSNGPVPLELWGFDQKACKHAVLENARSVGWKGTVEGYLFHKSWTIHPLVFTAPHPPAPCPKCNSYAAMSWIGNNVYGNSSSINSVKEAMHYAGQVPELKDTIKALQAKVAEQDTLIEQCAESLTYAKTQLACHGYGAQVINDLLAAIAKDAQ